MSERFHLGDLLSVTTQALVSPSHMDGVYRLVDHVTGEQHFTHQLPRAADVVAPWLIEQFPWLKGIKAPEFDIPSDATHDEAAATVAAWVDGLAERHGTWHDVEPMPPGMYVGREPIAEFREMAPDAGVIIVEVGEGDGAP